MEWVEVKVDMGKAARTAASSFPPLQPAAVLG